MTDKEDIARFYIDLGVCPDCWTPLGAPDQCGDHHCAECGWPHDQLVTHTCEHPGCDRTCTVLCKPPDYLPDLKPAYYCEEHARENGHCWNCGGFFADTEDFRENTSGICGACWAGVSMAYWDTFGILISWETLESAK